MKWVSTRGQAIPCTTSDAIVRGLASDGGLLVPETWPKLAMDASWSDSEFSDFAARVLTPFFAGDPLADRMSDICAKAFTFPVPVRKLRGARTELSILELFHGPTLAFKDFGARFFGSKL